MFDVARNAAMIRAAARCRAAAAPLRAAAAAAAPRARALSVGIHAQDKGAVTETTESGTPLPPHVLDPTYIYLPDFLPSFVQTYIMRHVAWGIRERELEMKKLGLWYDDTLDESPEFNEAGNRLSAEELQARTRRRKRAGDLSMKHEHLPKSMWPTTTELRTPYLSKHVVQVREEWMEKERFADLLEGKSVNEHTLPAGGLMGFFPGRWYKLEWDEDDGAAH